LRGIIDVPIEINGTGISSGSFEFAGSSFTVTYTIDAVAQRYDQMNAAVIIEKIAKKQDMLSPASN
jgi:hypothetical protein